MMTYYIKNKSNNDYHLKNNDGNKILNVCKGTEYSLKLQSGEKYYFVKDHGSKKHRKFRITHNGIIKNDSKYLYKTTLPTTCVPLETNVGTFGNIVWPVHFCTKVWVPHEKMIEILY